MTLRSGSGETSLPRLTSGCRELRRRSVVFSVTTSNTLILSQIIDTRLKKKKLVFVSPLTEREPGGGERRGGTKEERKKTRGGGNVSHTLARVDENKVANLEIIQVSSPSRLKLAFRSCVAV